MSHPEVGIRRTGPRTAKGRATSARIVEAAAQLIFERGAAGTTTGDIQEAAGVSSSQLYLYFPDKDMLTRAVIAHQTEALINAQKALLSRLDSIEGLRAWRDFIVATLRARGCLGGCPLGSLASELADHHPAVRADLMSSFARWESAIRDGLQLMVDRGELDSGADPAYLAMALLAALQGGTLLAQTRQDTTVLDAALDAMIERIALHATTHTPDTV
jgi:TetR/AcrR family transcriptional repressor of nem operon